MKLEKDEKVFYMRISYDEISEANTRTILSVDHVGGYVFITLDNGHYFQIKPFEKEFPIFHTSTGSIHEFLTEDSKEGRRLIKQSIQRELETVLSQLGKLRSQKNDLETVFNNFKID